MVVALPDLQTIVLQDMIYQADTNLKFSRSKS